jgi:hypothetical protein
MKFTEEAKNIFIKRLTSRIGENMIYESWSCSKLANLIRGDKKPNALEAHEWSNWHQSSKEKHPIRYWIAEEFLDGMQRTLFYISEKYNNIRCYIRNRWITQSYALKANKKDIARGQWCEYGDRILPCLFNELVNFVEVDKAWMEYISYPEKYYVPLWRKISAFRFAEWRNPTAGLAYLDWEISLKWGNNDGILPTDKRYGKPTFQSETAKELKELYLWWKTIYPARIDAYELSGILALHDEKRASSENKNDFWKIFDHTTETSEYKAAYKKAINNCVKIEKQYADEETQMLIRLIKIRQSLWT